MFLIEVYLFFALFFLLCFCIVLKNNTSLILYRNSNFFSLLIIFYCYLLLRNNLIFDYTNIHFFYTELILFFKYIVLFNFFIIFCLSFFYNFNIFEFCILLLLCLFSIFLLIGCTDLVGIYLLLELQSFCFYILTALKTGSNLSLEAALKYFILGSLISGLYIFGTSIIYGLLTITDLYEIKLFFEFFDFNNNIFLINISVYLILISFLFKLGIIPFHMYIPDVYMGAPSIIMVLFIILQKFVISILFMLFYYCIFIYFNLNYILFILVIITLFFGSLLSIAQSQIKKLIIYSSIVNSGYIICSIILNNLEGFISTFFFLFIYILLMCSFFIFFFSFVKYNNNNKLLYVRDFIYLKNTNLILSICFIFILFSLAGLPPLVGFFSKLFIFFSLSKSSLYVLMFVILLTSLLVIYYYIRLVYFIFFFNINYKFNFFKPLNKGVSYIIFPVFIINFFFGFYSKYLINIFEILIIKHFIYI